MFEMTITSDHIVVKVLHKTLSHVLGHLWSSKNTFANVIINVEQPVYPVCQS
jgi:hypothetical protein